jgi:hypothetical protein
MSRFAKLVVFVLPLILAGYPLPAQQILRVKWNATGGNDGSSWNDAYTNLQTALAAVAAGGEIWVAAGTYRPGLPGNRNATFTLVDGAGVYGGFDGTETTREQRDPVLNETILSGDLGQDDTPGASPWYSGNIHYGDNAYHVVTSTNDGAATVLDGVTISAGYAIGGASSAGAGILVTAGSPSFRRCRIRRNYGQSGGGMMLAGGTPAVTDCEFVENLTWGTYGGGLSVGDNTSPTIARNTFRGNVVLYAGGPEPVGGAISIGFNDPITISDCLFVGNKTDSLFGVPFYPAKGGAIFGFPDGVQLLRCTFVGNTSHEGGAVMSFGAITIRDCVFNKNQAFSYDYGGVGLGGWGGAVALVELTSTTSSSTVTGCTFIRNTASDSGGGLLASGAANVDLRSSIFWDNSVGAGNFGMAQVHGAKPKYSCVQNLFVPEPGEDPFDPADVPGSFDAPPQFADYDGSNGIPGDEDDDLHLVASSPCVDAGDPAFAPAGFDREGNQRYLDGNLDGSLRVDCGAFERALLRLSTALLSAGPGMQTLTTNVTGVPGTVAVLAAGIPGPPVLAVPLGYVSLNLGADYLLIPLGPAPASQSFTIPLLGGIAIALQAGTVTPSGAGQVSNPVTIEL